MADFTTELYTIYLNIDGEQFAILPEDIENFYFIEDIFSYSIVGKLQCYDRYGFIEFAPLTGYSEVGISYGVEEDKVRVFDIFKISKITPSSTSNFQGMHNYLEIIFTDKMFSKLTDNVYSTSWKEKKHSDIVSIISDKALGITDFEIFEESNEKFDIFYMPWWTPKQAIDWIMKRSSGSESGQPSYLFFNNTAAENTYGIATNYVTLEKLMRDDGVDEELMKASSGDDGVYYMKSENLTVPNKILGYDVNSVDYHSRKEIKGGYRIGYDFKRKKLLTEEYKYSKGVSDSTLLGRFSLFPDISEVNTNISNHGEFNEDIIKNMYFNDWIKRYSMQQTVSILVQGHEARHAGGMIEVIWPSSSEKEKFNKNTSGKYLIKSITHQFSAARPYYRQKLILIKNAYEDSDSMELMDASKKNLGSN